MMIEQKTFDKMFFVYRYLRDSLVKPASLDITDVAFVRSYINEFNPNFSENLLGTVKCADLEKILNSMCTRLILERKQIGLNPWSEANTDTKTWQYSLTDYSHTIIDGYQDYFLNLMVKKMKRKK